jgi:hypothetical protein
MGLHAVTGILSPLISFFFSEPKESVREREGDKKVEGEK